MGDAKGREGTRKFGQRGNYLETNRVSRNCLGEGDSCGDVGKVALQLVEGGAVVCLGGAAGAHELAPLGVDDAVGIGAAGQHEGNDFAEGIDVRRGVGSDALDLFGRDGFGVHSN